MDIRTAIKSRRSIRKCKDKKIPPEPIKHLKEALIWAPSAGNLQARKFYFVYKESIRKKLSEGALGQEFIAKCPLVIVCCTDLDKIVTQYGERGEKVYSVCDVSASIQNMMLAAAGDGLGTCWIGAFNEARISMIMNLPEGMRPIALVTVGYPDESPEPPKRASEKDVIEEIE